MEDKELRPWYREFWPWFLMAMPAAAVVGGIITLRIAANTDDGVVEDDYYKQGLAINRVLARGEAAAAFGLQGELHIDGGRVRLELTGQPTQWPEQVVLRVLHPTRAGHDQTLLLAREGAATYEGRGAALGNGKWKLVLEDAARTWRLSGEIEPGATRARLLPLQ